MINYFKTRITNGFAEGLNNKIKLTKRIGNWLQRSQS
ncbi:transposase [Halanaerobium salsuginis]